MIEPEIEAPAAPTAPSEPKLYVFQVTYRGDEENGSYVTLVRDTEEAVTAIEADLDLNQDIYYNVLNGTILNAAEFREEESGYFPDVVNDEDDEEDEGAEPREQGMD